MSWNGQISLRDNLVWAFCCFFPKPGEGYVQTLLNIDDDHDDDDCNGNDDDITIEDNNLVELFVVFFPNQGEGMFKRC